MNIGKVHNLEFTVGYEISRAIFVILGHKLVVKFHSAKAVDVAFHVFCVLLVQQGNYTENQGKTQNGGNQMDMTSRQLGRVEACCFALEEATEKNLVAARLVKVIRETLEEITQTAFPGELDQDWDMEFKNAANDPVAQFPPVQADKTPEKIRDYGQELLEHGVAAKDLINLLMDYFGMNQTDFAQLIGVNQGSLSKYLNQGKRRDAVLTKLTEFFGANGGAK